MDEYSDARGCNRRTIVIVRAEELGPRGELGIDAGSTEEIEAEFRLWEEAVP